ncbi:MAG TPA: ribbon-helix-helix domain-containing protein [Candidatus Thermoplasmatota archaeon]|nr:ribbon-helix-helix domain-containing protein [Candidatus Thermoplasmatota archaeon]
MPRGRGKRTEAGTPFKPAGLPASLAEEVDRFIAEHPGAGWTSRSAFAAEACRFYMREVVRWESEEAALRERKAASRSAAGGEGKASEGRAHPG